MNFMYKIEVCCPENSVENLRKAIADNGGGSVNGYTNCSFVTPGYSYFMPTEEANPYVGEKFKLNKILEYKIEVVCSGEILNNLVQTIKDVHPYEEVIVNTYKLINM